MPHDLTAARKNARTDADAAAIAWAQDEIERLRDALQAAEDADQKAIHCEEHQPEMAPESCGECFPLADDARLKRWAALGINQSKE